MSTALLADLIAELRSLSTATRFLVAYSGGMDSQVLLHALVAWRKQADIQIRAVHVHHGLSLAADQWYAHCHNICQELLVPLETRAVDLQPALERGDSLEAAARAARYEVFASIIEPDEVLLTAHHQEDQAETVLLRLLRGSGVKGLSAMSKCSSYHHYTVLRPLLSQPHAVLRDYADQAGFLWVHDDSNTDMRFDRNFLRHRILPLLRERWPSATRTLTRSAQHCAAADTLLEEYVQEDLQRSQGNVAGSLSLSVLHGYTLERQAQVLRAWITQQVSDQHGGTLKLPSSVVLRRIVDEVLNSRVDAMPCVRWGNIVVQRYRDVVYCQQDLSRKLPVKPTAWCNLSQPFALPCGLGLLSAELVYGAGIRREYKNGLFVGFRSGGERIHLPGRHGQRRLKKCFQEWGVPPWKRAIIPLLFDGQRLVAVVGYAVDADYAAAPDEWGYRLLMRDC